MKNVTLTNEQFQALLVAAREGGAANSMAEGSGSSKAAKPLRPSVDMDTTEGEWGLFLDNWARYKRMSNLVDLTDLRQLTSMLHCFLQQTTF